MQGLGLNKCAPRDAGAAFSRLATDHLPRPRLMESLAGRKRLRLLCAPAGYGKTVALGELLENLAAGQKQLWFNCSGQPQTLASLCTLISQALGLAPDTTAEALLRCLDSRVKPFWLVLDDLAGDNPDGINDWIEQLLTLQGNSVQLLVSCRTRPDWNLPRLVLEGELLELGPSQLALTRPEFETFVDRLRARTNVRSRDVLWGETQGWCAGVRLLLSSLSSSVTPDFRSPVVLCEYLQYEVLAHLDADECEVLFGLAHLSKANTALCNQLWEEQHGGRIFQRLLRHQAFLVPIDNHPNWYRLLPAVAHALQDRLAAVALGRLRLRACQLLSSFGHFDDAIEHALCAEQPEVAASYMEQLRLAWLLNDRHLERLMIWRDRLPAYLLESSPRLIYLCARALMFSGRLDEAEDCLQRLRQFLPFPDAERNQRLLANWQVLHGSLQALRGNTLEARQHCQAGRNSLGAQDWLSVLLCLSILARVAMIEADLPAADRLLEEGVELARRQGNRDAEVLINTDRVRLRIYQGQPGLAQAILDKDLEYLAGKGEQPDPLRGRLLFLKGELLLLKEAENEAEQALHSGLRQVRDCSAPFILSGYLLLSELAARRQCYEDARLLLHEAERRMHWGKIDFACYGNALALQKARVLAHEQPPGVSLIGTPNVPTYQDELTAREVSVLKLLAEGMSVREVGKSLFISVNTVKTHAKNINVKLGACRRTQAINSAKAIGILV